LPLPFAFAVVSDLFFNDDVMCSSAAAGVWFPFYKIISETNLGLWDGNDGIGMIILLLAVEEVVFCIKLASFNKQISVFNSLLLGVDGLVFLG
jgi:hypothetical protein